MKTITRKVFSLCDDFNPDEGFEEIYNELSKYNTSDTYIEYTAMTGDSQWENGHCNDDISLRLIELGADDYENVLIHIDY